MFEPCGRLKNFRKSSGLRKARYVASLPVFLVSSHGSAFSGQLVLTRLSCLQVWAMLLRDLQEAIMDDETLDEEERGDVLRSLDKLRRTAVAT